MTYGTPVTSDRADYRAVFKNTGTPADGAFVTITMEQGEGGMTPTAQDALFQELVDLLSGSAYFQATGELSRTQHVTSQITVTP